MIFGVDGFTMYHAMPARRGPPSVLSAVSSAPHSLPLAYVTCCIRVSFESGREITSLCGGGPTSRAQQPTNPVKSIVVVSLMQFPCGVSVVASAPEPGCVCFGGRAYGFTDTMRLLRLSAGEALLSEAVLVSVHTTIWFEVWLPLLPDTGWVASSAAFELMKYSVPPFSVLNSGAVAGHTVKPGCVGPASLGTFTSPEVSICT